MVGDDAGTSGFRPLEGPHGPMPKTAGLFGVLNTDAAAKAVLQTRRCLMSPQEVRAKGTEFGWEDYTSKLTAFLAKFPQVTTAVNEFQREFSTTAASAPK